MEPIQDYIEMSIPVFVNKLLLFVKCTSLNVSNMPRICIIVFANGYYVREIYLYFIYVLLSVRTVRFILIIQLLNQG